MTSSFKRLQAEQAYLKRLRAELGRLGDQHKEWKRQVPLLQDLIRKADAAGMKQAEIVELTGYARDNIRLLCMSPEQREELRRRRRVGTDTVALADQVQLSAPGIHSPDCRCPLCQEAMQRAAQRRGSRTKRT